MRQTRKNTQRKVKYFIHIGHRPPPRHSSYPAGVLLACLLKPRSHSKPCWRASTRTSARSSSGARAPFSTCIPGNEGPRWVRELAQDLAQQTGDLNARLTLLRTLWYISRKTSSRARVKASALVTLSSRPAPMCSRKLHTDMPSSRTVASCSIRSSSSFPSHSWLIAVEIFFRRYSNCKSVQQKTKSNADYDWLCQ